MFECISHYVDDGEILTSFMGSCHVVHLHFPVYSLEPHINCVCLLCKSTTYYLSAHIRAPKNGFVKSIQKGPVAPKHDQPQRNLLPNFLKVSQWMTPVCDLCIQVVVKS